MGQYRYPTNTYEWEIPEGGADEGEELLEAAQRELLEETGICAGSWEQILELQLSNSTSDELAYIFIARDLTFTEASPDPTEKIVVRKIPLAQAFEMAERGEMRDAMSVVGLLKARLLLDQNAL